MAPFSGWTVIVPVKTLHVAKSRLGGDPVARATLALAMASDVVDSASACAGVGAVVVVTDDERVRHALAAVAEVIPDQPRGGLSAALAHGGSVAAARWPAAGVAALAADLPALTSATLAAVLTGAAPQPRAVVADADGTGTVVLTAAPGQVLAPAYEGASFAAHRDGGATDLTALADPRVRRDVDTVADLAVALALGAGPATTAAAAAWRAAGWRS